MSHTLKHSLIYLACMSALYVSHESQAQDTSEANDVEVVEVLGIRSSLTGALDNKRSADSVVDSISAEDLGKFPDQNIAYKTSTVLTGPASIILTGCR
ncbi:MAG: hypothetical protein MK214_00060 [Thalassotalea sp.]|nr:hypothetical protein [Thalassotalea sp.]